MSSPTPLMPTGTGVFARTLRTHTHGTPAELARRCRDHGISFVPLLGLWQTPTADQFRNDRTLDAYADALHAAGVGVWLWGYPHAGREGPFARAMVLRARRIRARGLILDPEVSYRGRLAAMRSLIAHVLDELDESLGVGFSSYGIPRLHQRFPWRAAEGIGWGAPQFYRARPARIPAAMSEWAQLGWTHQLPVLPTFGAHGEPGHLRTLIDTASAHPATRGLLFWSWNTTKLRHLRVLEDAATRFQG